VAMQELILRFGMESIYSLLLATRK